MALTCQILMAFLSLKIFYESYRLLIYEYCAYKFVNVI